MTRPPYPDDIPTAITHREADLLAELTAGKHVLEIGSAWGYSTVWMALNGAWVTAVDPHTWADTRSVFDANLRRYAVTERVNACYIPSQAVDAELAGFTWEAAFIDGDHSYDNAHFDLALARRVVEPGGWIIAHDYSFPGYGAGGWPGVVLAVNELLGQYPERHRAGTIYAARAAGVARQRAS